MRFLTSKWRMKVKMFLGFLTWLISWTLVYCRTVQSNGLTYLCIITSFCHLLPSMEPCQMWMIQLFSEWSYLHSPYQTCWTTAVFLSPTCPNFIFPNQIEPCSVVLSHSFEAEMSAQPSQQNLSACCLGVLRCSNYFNQPILFFDHISDQPFKRYLCSFKYMSSLLSSNHWNRLQ